jgi:Cu+-exporting ATPase
VEANEIVPADGHVESGTRVTGRILADRRTRPVPVKIGDPVKSGTRLIDGRVVARAEKVGGDTILGRMIAIMARSLEQKSVFEGRTDRMLRWFVPII